MDNETQKIFAEQLNKLPKEVVSFISSGTWSEDAEEIGSLYNLSEDELSIFTREIMFVLAGLTHPDEFIDVLEKQGGIKGAVLEALVLNVEKKIFTPILPALIEFFEEEAKIVESEKSQVESGEQGAPENLPTEDTSTAFLPKLIPKTIEPVISPAGASAVHPFEEKMKNVFTASQPTTLELPQVEVDIPRPPAPFVAPSGDPYREPIE